MLAMATACPRAGVIAMLRSPFDARALFDLLDAPATAAMPSRISMRATFASAATARTHLEPLHAVMVLEVPELGLRRTIEHVLSLD